MPLRPNAIARSARSANHPGALRRTSLGHSPADGVARPPFISLRAALPPAARCGSPSRGRNVLRPRLRGRGCGPRGKSPALRPLRLPPARRPHSAPFPSFDRHRLLVRPALLVRHQQTNTNAARRRRQAPRPVSRVLACRRRLAQPQRPRPRSRPPRNLRVGSSLGPASCAGGLRCSPRPTRLGTASSSFARLTHIPMQTRAQPRGIPFVRPAPAVPGPALAMAGEASARARALRRPRLRPASCPHPSSARPFPRPRPASRACSVTAAAGSPRTARKRHWHCSPARFPAAEANLVGLEWLTAIEVPETTHDQRGPPPRSTPWPPRAGRAKVAGRPTRGAFAPTRPIGIVDRDLPAHPANRAGEHPRP